MLPLTDPFYGRVRLLTPALDFLDRVPDTEPMNNAETTVLTISVADAQVGDVILDGPFGGERTVLGAYRANWTDYDVPVRSLAHLEVAQPEVRTADSITFATVGGVRDFLYGLDDEIVVRRSVSAA